MINIKSCPECYSTTIFYDKSRAEKYCSCGLVLYRDYIYSNGCRGRFPQRTDTDFKITNYNGSVLDYQVQSWRTWLNKNHPRIYPKD